MRLLTMLCLSAIAAFYSTGASADPVTFHPEGCDFEISFPSAPTLVKTKTETSRGDSVDTARATLNDGANYLRAECTHVPAMNFFDEGILLNNMQEMGASYKLDGLITRVEHNEATGPVGWLTGKGKLGGHDVTIEVRRYTGKASIFDVWIASAPDGFPAPVETDFLKTVKVDGKPAQ